MKFKTGRKFDILIIKNICALSFLLASFFFTGCSTIAPNPYLGDKRVAFDNLSPSDFKILEITANKSLNTNRIEAKVTIENNCTSITDALESEKNYSLISYRFVWFDTNGNPIPEENATIMPLMFKPGDKVIFSAIAPNPFCTTFCLKLKSLEK